jgi:hypothetical protein
MLFLELILGIIAWGESENGKKLIPLFIVALFEGLIILLIVTEDLPEYKLIACILILQFIEIRILQIYSERYLKILAMMNRFFKTSRGWLHLLWQDII